MSGISPNPPRIHLSAQPLVDYVEAVRNKTEGDLLSLSVYFGISVRQLSRYMNIKDGHMQAKSAVVPLTMADTMLTYVGDETLNTLWDTHELDGNYRPAPTFHPRCERCNTELLKRTKAMRCGFCTEELTGKTLTYRLRELY